MEEEGDFPGPLVADRTKRPYRRTRRLASGEAVKFPAGNFKPNDYRIGARSEPRSDGAPSFSRLPDYTSGYRSLSFCIICVIFFMLQACCIYSPANSLCANPAERRINPLVMPVLAPLGRIGPSTRCLHGRRLPPSPSPSMSPFKSSALGAELFL